MEKLREVKIKCPGPTGIGTTIEVDGKRIERPTRIQVDILLGIPKLTVEQNLYGYELGIEGKFDVDEIFTVPDRPGERYRLVKVEDADPQESRLLQEGAGGS